MIKLKKSLTVDGGSSTSLSSKLSGRGFSKSMLLGPLSLGKKDKKDDKDSGIQTGEPAVDRHRYIILVN